MALISVILPSIFGDVHHQQSTHYMILYVWASGGHFCWYSLACKDECPPLAFAMLVGTEPQWKKWYVTTWRSRSGQTIREAKQATGLQIACGSIVEDITPFLGVPCASHFHLYLEHLSGMRDWAVDDLRYNGNTTTGLTWFNYQGCNQQLYAGIVGYLLGIHWEYPDISWGYIGGAPGP